MLNRLEAIVPPKFLGRFHAVVDWDYCRLDSFPKTSPRQPRLSSIDDWDKCRNSFTTKSIEGNEEFLLNHSKKCLTDCGGGGYNSAEILKEVY